MDLRLRHLSILALSFVLAACPGRGQSERCKDGVCVTVLSSGFSTDSCGAGETCDYANVWFTVTRDGVSVGGLTSDDVDLIIDGRDYGSESGEAICPSTELRVRLLLDRSFSIYNDGNVGNVRDGAAAFLERMAEASPGGGDCEDSLGALVAMAVFASEDEVPLYCNASGSLGGSESFLAPETALDALDDCYQVPDQSTSTTFTKLYDAILNWSSEPLGDGSARFLPVMVAFTDGRDTASEAYESATAARQSLDQVATVQRLYAIAFEGDDVLEEELGTLADDRVWVEDSPEDLDVAFEAVADELGRIYRLRILVPEREDGAPSELIVFPDDENVVTPVELGEAAAPAPADDDDVADSGPGGCSTSVDTCEDTCSAANNGICEDGGSGSDAWECEYGTDCADCGRRDKGFGCFVVDPGALGPRGMALLLGVMALLGALSRRRRG